MGRPVTARFLVAAAVSLVFMALAWTAPQGESGITFRTAAKLVLVPFEFVPGDGSTTPLNPADVMLLEDGAPRSFTILEPPTTRR
jgi:hypothetical protein